MLLLILLLCYAKVLWERSRPNTTPPPGLRLPRRRQTTLISTYQLLSISHVRFRNPRIFKLTITFPTAKILFAPTCHAVLEYTWNFKLLRSINNNGLLFLKLTIKQFQLTNMKYIVNIPSNRNIQLICNTTYFLSYKIWSSL